jgi:hypothetical protein
VSGRDGDYLNWFEASIIYWREALRQHLAIESTTYSHPRHREVVLAGSVARGCAKFRCLSAPNHSTATLTVVPLIVAVVAPQIVADRYYWIVFVLQLCGTEIPPSRPTLKIFGFLYTYDTTRNLETLRTVSGIS